MDEQGGKGEGRETREGIGRAVFRWFPCVPEQSRLQVGVVGTLMRKVLVVIEEGGRRERREN